MSETKKLPNSQIKFLRGIAHGINPVITIGNNGITESLMEELESSLSYHEILKVKIASAERGDRKAIIDQIVATTGAHLVQSIGKIFVIFRPNPETEIELPK